jgi:hypothetical protein
MTGKGMRICEAKEAKLLLSARLKAPKEPNLGGSKELK